MAEPSASAQQLAATCAGSAAQDRIGHAFEAAAKGSAKHAALESDTERADALLSVAGFAPIKGAEVRREAAFAYDVDTEKVRFLGYGRGAYATANLGPREVPGTLDYIEQTKTDAQVIDYKAGRPQFVPAAKDSYQLAFAALVSERPKVRAAFLFVADEEDPFARWVDYDAFDLADWRERFRRVADEVDAARAAVAKGEQPALTIGSHCRYCPARFGCKAITGLVAIVHEQSATVEEKVDALMAAGHPEQAYQLVKATEAAYKNFTAQADAMMERLYAPVYAAARNDGIPLGNGKVVKLVATSRRSIDGDAGWTLLTEKYGPEVATAATEKKITQASLKAVLGAAKSREAMAALDDAGAVTVKTYSDVKEVDQ